MSVQADPVVRTEQDEYEFREISWLAVASLILALLGSGGFIFIEWLHPAVFAILPILGLIAALAALARIRRYDLSGTVCARVGLAGSAIVLLAGWGTMGFRYATEVPAGFDRISYARLQPEKPGELIPQSAKELDGKKIYIKGYIYPSEPEKGKKELLLCRDQGTCCFGGQPKLTDMIHVVLLGDLRMDYDSQLHGVAGTFRVEQGMTDRGGTMVTVLYRLDCEHIR